MIVRVDHEPKPVDPEHRGHTIILNGWVFNFKRGQPAGPLPRGERGEREGGKGLPLAGEGWGSAPPSPLGRERGRGQKRRIRDGSPEGRDRLAGSVQDSPAACGREAERQPATSSCLRR